MPAGSDRIIDTTPVSTPRKRRPRRPTRLRTREELDRAITLRPAEIFARYGIPATTVQRYCTTLPPENRLPSIRIGAWRGRRGVRLIEKPDLDAWLAWQKSGSEKTFITWRAAQSGA
jgi:hypothetical protein